MTREQPTVDRDAFARECRGPGCLCEDYGDVEGHRRLNEIKRGAPWWIRTNRDEVEAWA